MATGQSKQLQTNTADAICVANSTESNNFNRYIAQCRKTNDAGNVTNFFNGQTAQKYKDVFAQLRAEYNNLIIMGDGVNDTASLTGASTNAANTQIQSLNAKKQKLLNEIKHYERLSSNADKTFLEDVFYGAPQPKSLVSPQDVAVFIFWFGWLTLGITLIAIRVGSPSGSLLSGLFVLAIYSLVSLTIYGLLQRFA